MTTRAPDFSTLDDETRAWLKDRLTVLGFEMFDLSFELCDCLFHVYPRLKSLVVLEIQMIAEFRMTISGRLRPKLVK